MDLKINEMAFQGKKEVLYGLKKAADNVHSCCIYNQPRLMAFGENKNAGKYEAVAKAYLDMALRDEAFEKTIKTIKASELYFLNEILKPVQVIHSLLKPIDTFKTIMQDVLNSLGHKKVSREESVSKLYKKLEL